MGASELCVGFLSPEGRTSRLIKPTFRARVCSIMLAGIVIQLAVMVFYVLYMAIWAWKAKVQVKRAGRRMEIMLLGMFVASVGIIVRGVSAFTASPRFGQNRR